MQVALLLHEAVLLLGLFAAEHPGHQEKLSWGPAPSVLQRLCAIPSLYLETTCLPNGGLAPPAATPPPATTPAELTAHRPASDDTPGASAAEPRIDPHGGGAPEGGFPAEGAATDAKAPVPEEEAAAPVAAAANEAAASAGCGSRAAEPPSYLLHVLFPTLLAACLDAPRNCAAVCDCLGSSGVLAYCASQCPADTSTASSVPSTRRCSTASSDAHDGRGGVRGGHEAAFAAGPAANDWEWDVDLGPLDGRFHPRHRIARADWARAEAQLRAAAVHTPHSMSDGTSGDSGALHVPGGCMHERPPDDGLERHLGAKDCISAGSAAQMPTASADCYRMTQESAIRKGDSHEGPA